MIRLRDLPRVALLPAAALALTLGVASPARAGFVPILTNPSPGGVGTIFTYNLAFSNGPTDAETLQTGDILTIYDFATGLTTANVTAPAAFTVSVQNTGITPGGGLLNPSDNPVFSNITFTYNGPTLTADTVFTVTITANGQAGVANRVGQYTSTDTLSSVGDNDQIGSVLLLNPVPEPSSVLLLGLALPLGLVLRRRLARG